MSLNESCVGHSCENCQPLLHMHTRTCMCGALFDVRAPPPPWEGTGLTKGGRLRGGGYFWLYGRVSLGWG